MGEAAEKLYLLTVEVVEAREQIRDCVFSSCFELRWIYSMFALYFLFHWYKWKTIAMNCNQKSKQRKKLHDRLFQQLGRGGNKLLDKLCCKQYLCHVNSFQHGWQFHIRNRPLMMTISWWLRLQKLQKCVFTFCAHLSWLTFKSKDSV